MKTGNPGLAFAASLGAITLVGPLSIHLFLPAMPAVKVGLGVSDAAVQLAFSVTLIAMAVVTPAYGSLSDRYGRRPVLLAGLGLFLLGSLVSALAMTLPMLILGRLVQAMGAGCGVPLARAIARDAYGPAALVTAIAYLTMAYTLGPMTAPAMGGLLIDLFGWRSEFVFAVLAGVVILAAAARMLPETRATTERQSAIALLRHYGTLLRDRRFLAFVLQSGFMSFAFFALAASSPFLMRDLLGRSATEYGLWFICIPVGYCAGNLVSSRLGGRVAIETMVMAGSLLCLADVAVQAALILTGHLSPAIIFAPGAFMSFAQGLALPNAQAGALRVQPALAGTAAGLGVFMQMLLSGLAAELYGVVANGTPVPMVAICAVGSILAVLCAAALLPRPGARDPALPVSEAPHV
jgi:DHA1 family bicyclomycin/chloramphenicol resistance-like MFS transporter